jgi:hypothetical protein
VHGVAGVGVLVLLGNGDEGVVGHHAGKQGPAERRESGALEHGTDVSAAREHDRADDLPAARRQSVGVDETQNRAAEVCGQHVSLRELLEGHQVPGADADALTQGQVRGEQQICHVRR